MPISDNVKDILSFGAHNRVEGKRAEFDDLRSQLETAVTERDLAALQINRELQDHTFIKENALAALRKIQQISKHLTAAERIWDKTELPELTRPILLPHGIAIDDAELTGNAVRSMVAAASTALGAWAFLGSAGTGSATALGTALTGVTGGALAAGAATVGGIVLLPAAALMAIFSHISADKKIAELEKIISEALRLLAETRAAQLAMTHLQRRLSEINSATQKATEVFSLEMEKNRRKLFPLGFFSRWLKGIRKFFGGNYFSQSDLKILLPLLQMARVLAGLIDQKILDKQGKAV